MRSIANQMKRSLMQWGHGTCDDEKIASDLARYTDGKIQLDLDTFKFEKINAMRVCLSLVIRRKSKITTHGILYHRRSDIG